MLSISAISDDILGALALEVSFAGNVSPGYQPDSLPFHSGL